MELWHQITLGAVLFLLVVVHFWLLIRTHILAENNSCKLGQVLNNMASHVYVMERFNTVINTVENCNLGHRATQESVAQLDHYLRLEFDILIHHFQTDIAASILEAHFRKKKDEEGLMLVNSIRPLLQRKVPRKKKQTDIDRIQSDS